MIIERWDNDRAREREREEGREKGRVEREEGEDESGLWTVDHS